MVVYFFIFGDVFCLEGDLKIVRVYVECYGIYVNKVVWCGVILDVVVFGLVVKVVVDSWVFLWLWCVFIFEYRYVDLYFVVMLGLNVGSECWEMNVRIGDFIGDKL